MEKSGSWGHFNYVQKQCAAPPLLLSCLARLHEQNELMYKAGFGYQKGLFRTLCMQCCNVGKNGLFFVDSVDSPAHQVVSVCATRRQHLFLHLSKLSNVPDLCAVRRTEPPIFSLFFACEISGGHAVLDASRMQRPPPSTTAVGRWPCGMYCACHSTMGCLPSSTPEMRPVLTTNSLSRLFSDADAVEKRSQFRTSFVLASSSRLVYARLTPALVSISSLHRSFFG